MPDMDPLAFAANTSQPVIPPQQIDGTPPPNIDVSQQQQQMGMPQTQAAPAPPKQYNPNQDNKLPAIVELAKGLIKPPSDQAVSTGNGLYRPANRLDVFENFLGNFLQSFATGMSQSGTGPAANLRGAGAAIMAGPNLAMQRQNFANQQAQTQAETQATQARTAQTEAQTRQIGNQIMIPTPNGPMYLPQAIAAQYMRGQGAATIANQGKKDLATINGEYALKKQQLQTQGKLAASADKITLTNGIPTAITDLDGKVWRADDPALPEELKARIQTAQNAYQQKQADQMKLMQARGQAFQQAKPVTAIDGEGNAVYMPAGQAMAQGATPLGEGAKIMSKQAQFGEIHSASTKLRDAIGKMEPFSASQVLDLNKAMDAGHGLVHDEVTGMFRNALTPAQEDFVIWATQMNERAMSLRNIAGMGQGAEDLRQAIRNTLPGAASGNKAFALKQLDAFDNQVNQLEKGIPKIKRGGDTKSNVDSLVSKYK